jgi:hypothetical protein
MGNVIPAAAAAKAQPSAPRAGLYAARAQAFKLNWGLRVFFSQMLRVSLRRPAQALFFARTVVWQTQAARRRAKAAREDGLHVPPIAVFSITKRCS